MSGAIPTLREIIAESGGAPVVKRTGKGRIEGVDYVRKSPGEARWLSGGKSSLSCGTRKPTAGELADRWAMCERQWAESCEAAGWRRQAWRVADDRFALTFQRALMAAIDAKPKQSPKPKRAAKVAPKPKPSATPKPAPVAVSAAPAGSHELIRMYRRELQELGTPAALAEIERRKAKRAARKAARTF